MSCHVCGVATAPGDRFCAACGASLERRCATCGTALPDDARFCPSCGTPVAAAGADEGAGTPGEERKVVSVLFADLVGFTALSDGADPEDVRRRVQPFHTLLREVVEGYGGRIEKLMGDGVLAVFGAPIVHEDDAERAVRAGLEIQDRVRALGEAAALKARVAIGTGEAMVAVEGATADREGLIGDVVNTAARLQAEAEPGSVLVDDATHRATRRAFHYEERPPVLVKGKSRPLEVWVAIEPVARLGADLEDDGATLVGRTTELSLLTDAFTRAVADETSQIVTIAGEPGVGKSRLVRELRRHISQLPDLIRWRQSRCLPYGEGITYWALGEIVKAEAGILETDTPATALGKLAVSLEPLLIDPDERVWVNGRLAPLVGSDQESAAEREERFAAWHRYLAALGEQRPTVMIVEDLHWADANLVDFLADVPEATRGTPLLLVCTARPDFFEVHPTWGAGQRNAVTIRLEPLDVDSTTVLLRELLHGEGLEEEALDTVVDRSGGNPLWAQEFVRMLRDRDPTSPDLPIPDTVQSVVASRIDLLDTEAKAIVQAASTVGKSFWRGAVASVLQDDSGLDEALRELSRRELIRRERMSTMSGESEYAFTHSVVRDVAYGQTPRAVRAERHHLVARWIERMAGDRVSDRAEVIAHHDAEALRLAAATDLPDVTRFEVMAVASHRRAAEQAARLDPNAQIAHLEAALELSPTVDATRAELLYALADAHNNRGSMDAGFKFLLESRDAFEAVDDVEGWGLAMAELSRYAWLSGDAVESERFLRDGIARLEQFSAGPALASLFVQESGRLWLRGDSPAEAMELIDRVTPIVEVHGDSAARRRLLSAEGGVRFDRGDPDAVKPFRQVLRMAVEADDSLGIGVAHLNLGEQLRTGWGCEEAVTVLNRGLEIALHRKTGGVEQFLRSALANNLVLAGQWDEALTHLDAAIASRDRLPYMAGGLFGPKMMIEAARGEATADMGAEIDRQVAAAEEMQDLQAVIPTYEAAVWVHLMGGNAASALEYAVRVAERSGGTRFLFDAWALTMWVLRQGGRLGMVMDNLEELRQFDMPRPRAQVRWLEALMAESNDPIGAMSELTAAAEALVELGVALDGAVALAEVARIARATDDDTGGEARARAVGLLAPTGAQRLLEVLELA